MPLSQKAFSGQTNVLCPCNTPSTFSSLRMGHRIYGLTLRVASWLFLVCWGFFISIYVWAADCALDTAGLKRDGAIRMANHSCLHRRSRFSRSAISGVSGTPRPTGRIHISPGDGALTLALVMVSKRESREKVNIQVGSATTDECTSSCAGRKEDIILCYFLWPQKENIIYRNKHCASVPRACDCPSCCKSSVPKVEKRSGSAEGNGWWHKLGVGTAVVLPPRSHESMSKAMARL